MLADFDRAAHVTYKPHSHEGNMILTYKDVISEFAYWAIYQSPYTSPDGLSQVLKDLASLLKVGHPLKMEGWHAFDCTLEEIDRTLTAFIHSHPQVLAWNERVNGNEAPFGFVSSHWAKESPDNDFIDLHALCWNITQQLRNKSALHQDIKDKE